MKYQNRRGGSVVFKDVLKPEKLEWSSGLEALEAALDLEKKVNQALLDIHGVGRAKLTVQPNAARFVGVLQKQTPKLGEQFVRVGFQRLAPLEDHVVRFGHHSHEQMRRTDRFPSGEVGGPDRGLQHQPARLVKSPFFEWSAGEENVVHESRCSTRFDRIGNATYASFGDYASIPRWFDAGLFDATVRVGTGRCQSDRNMFGPP